MGKRLILSEELFLKNTIVYFNIIITWNGCGFKKFVLVCVHSSLLYVFTVTLFVYTFFSSSLITDKMPTYEPPTETVCQVTRTIPHISNCYVNMIQLYYVKC